MSSRLSRIFIRAQDENGKWGNVSLDELSDDEFCKWYGKWMMRGFETRENMLTHLDRLGIPPTELKEGYDETE